MSESGAEARAVHPLVRSFQHSKLAKRLECVCFSSAFHLPRRNREPIVKRGSVKSAQSVTRSNENLCRRFFMTGNPQLAKLLRVAGPRAVLFPVSFAKSF